MSHDKILGFKIHFPRNPGFPLNILISAKVVKVLRYVGWIIVGI